MWRGLCTGDSGDRSRHRSAGMESNQSKGSRIVGSNTPNTDNGSCMYVGGGQGGLPREGCSVNIYINSNVQGVNNSLMFRSKVKMQDPGVHVYFRDIGLQSDSVNPKRWSGFDQTIKGAGLLVLTLLLLLIFWVTIRPTAAASCD